MNENRIECPIEAQRLHVALNVFTLRVELLTQLQHPRRKIDQRHLEMRLQVGGVVSATRSEFENIPTAARYRYRRICFLDQPPRELGLFSVIRRRRQKMKPRCELSVKFRQVRHERHVHRRSTPGSQYPDALL